ncbi:hypothetical protein [Bradyrhizobium tunisiense]|uniref:hypothetical protein n=1 Tax=Bradyrhizobium tunisiense TaxID=3278709 RepID=UPI0035D97E3E
MTNLQEQIELLEQQGNDAELLLASDPDTRARNRLVADKFRSLAVKLRRRVIAVADLRQVQLRSSFTPMIASRGLPRSKSGRTSAPRLLHP